IGLAEVRANVAAGGDVNLSAGTNARVALVGQNVAAKAQGDLWGWLGGTADVTATAWGNVQITATAGGNAAVVAGGTLTGNVTAWGSLTALGMGGLPAADPAGNTG